MAGSSPAMTVWVNASIHLSNAKATEKVGPGLRRDDELKLPRRYFTSTSSSASLLGPSIITARVSPSR